MRASTYVVRMNHYVGGRVPKPGDEVEWWPYYFKVVSVDAHEVKKNPTLAASFDEWTLTVEFVGHHELTGEYRVRRIHAETSLQKPGRVAVTFSRRTRS
jgi:hypothetical protein